MSGVDEATIGLAGLYQARSGGNRAMILNAERYLVTNVALTTRKRAALVAPWEKADTVCFLRQPATRSPSASTSPSPSRAQGWKMAMEADAMRKKTLRDMERTRDRNAEAEASYEALCAELQRAAVINRLRDKLNTDLLKVAEMASETFGKDLEEKCKGEKDDGLEAERRAAALEMIAEKLSLS